MLRYSFLYFFIEILSEVRHDSNQSSEVAGGDGVLKGWIVFGNVLTVADIPPFESAYAGRICF